MKHSLWIVFGALMTSGSAFATVNDAQGDSYVDLAGAIFDPLSLGLSYSTAAFSAPTTADSAQAPAMSLVSSTGTTVASAIGDPSNSSLANANSLASATKLTTYAHATDGTASSTASGTLSFTVTGAGNLLLEIPYTMVTNANSQALLSWNGSSSSGITGAWVNQADHLTSSTGASQNTSTVVVGNNNFSNSSALYFVLPNFGATPTRYALTLSTTSTADFSAPSVPVPEAPAPLLLSLGLCAPLLARRLRTMSRS